MREPIDPRLAELFQLYADDQLDPEQAETLHRALREDAATRDAFVAFCLHSQLLKEMLSEEAVLPDKVIRSADVSKPQTGRRPFMFAVALAACLLLMIGVWTWWPGGPADVPPKTPNAARWNIIPTGDAKFERTEPTLVRLDRGELFVESDPAVAGETIRIETPAGESVAKGTSFYIGAHQSQSEKENEMLKPITRVLVLSGIVTLATSAGSVDGSEGDLLTAQSDQLPVKVTVQANSDFAFDLYGRLAKENGGGNLFFSPYSISGALAMTAEGARGQTAKEMGDVLRFPDACNRVGKDAQLIPWKTSLIHTGYSTLNQNLHSSQLNPKHAEIKSRIDKLQAEYDALDAKLLEMEKAGFGGFGFGDGGFGQDPTSKSKKPFDQEEFSKLFQQRNELGERIRGLAAQISLHELRVANAIWGEKTYPFNQTYVDTIQKHYKTGGMFPVDFRNNFPAAREQINDWCAEQTNNRIQEILPPLPPEQGRLLRIVLTNAIYFKADWLAKFDPKRTKDLDFTRADGTKVKTAIMHALQLPYVRYAAFNADGSLFATPQHARPNRTTGLYPNADGFAIVELPYRGSDVSMVVIAPNRHDGLAAIEQKLNAANLTRWVGQLKDRTANIYLPRFKQETSYDLVETLTEMGMKHAFDETRADFSGMSDSASDPIYLSMVKHKAFVEVNETGTEAAAVTAVVGGLTGGPPEPEFIPDFRADRPFIYIIRDVASGSVLFLGRMTRPDASTETRAAD
jgi:serine protease inhibitor